ncbi:hypothetical protein L7F22_049796 [Adiantum nelumboides]|nr:hypothetical protein [Adiantum nelumboides]
MEYSSLGEVFLMGDIKGRTQSRQSETYDFGDSELLHPLDEARVERTSTNIAVPTPYGRHLLSDIDEELSLGSLWEHWKELSQKSDTVAEAEQALAEFLKAFLKTYENWVPEELLVGIDQNISLKERCIVFGCKSGHPTKVILGLTNELKNVTKMIGELKVVTYEGSGHIKFEERNDLLHALEILTRAAHNRRIFRSYEGLQSLVNLMKAIVVLLKCVVGSINIEKTEYSSVERLLVSLQGLLTYLITTISHFIEGAATHAFAKTYVEHDSLEESRLEDRLTVLRKEGTVPLMEMGGLNWFVELMRILQTLRVSGYPSNRSLQHLTLTTMRAALLGNLRAQNHFRSLGGIDVLLDAIGPPVSNCQFDADLKLRWPREDFQMQAVLLEVLRDAVFRNLSCLRYLFEKGGIDKFVEVIVWAAFIWPMEDNQEKDLDGDFVQGWNAQVSCLCKILCSFLVPSGDIRGFVTSLSVSQDIVSKVDSYWALALRWVAKVLLRVYKDMESWQVPRSHSSTLQHYTLHVFKKMLAASPTVLAVFREEGLWEVVFSKYFFYYEMDAAADSVDQESSQKEVNTFLHPYEKGADSEPLQLEVISLVELAATASGSYENGPECYALLTALENCAGIPTVSTMIVKSLHRILQLAPDQTVCAFKNLEALLLLSQVMDIQLQGYLKFTDSNGAYSSGDIALKDDGNAKVFTLRESWKLSRKAVFDLFAEYVLTSEEARVVSLHCAKTMQVILGLLWDPESRNFALTHILDVMKLAPTSKDDQEAKLELCIRYLETLSQSGFDGKPKDIDVLLDLLSGIREVLATDTLYYQSLFQEAECFVHIVSLLNENLSKEHGKLLCISVIQTLRMLLFRNSVAKV